MVNMTPLESALAKINSWKLLHPDENMQVIEFTPEEKQALTDMLDKYLAQIELPGSVYGRG